MQPILLVEARLQNYGRVKDGSMNLSFRTNKEITSEEAKQIDEYYQQNGFLVFKQDAIKLEDIPDGNSNTPGAKSMSSQLRLELFKKHMTTGGTKETFPAYYQRAMAGFIQAVEDSY